MRLQGKDILLRFVLTTYRGKDNVTQLTAQPMRLRQTLFISAPKSTDFGHLGGY